ncbi:hypothetical protein Tco_1128071, partial [Tanacetum coccineum]
MANLLQDNLALGERLDKHGTWLYNLEKLNITLKVSQDVDEIVTDAVDRAMRKLVKNDERDVTHQDLLLGLHHHNHLLQQAHLVLQGREVSSSSKTTASAQQSMAWTISDTRYESTGIAGAQELSPSDDLMHDDSEEYDIWAIKMEHYLESIDNDVWKVIQNGNSKKIISTRKDGVVRILPPVFAVEIHAVEKGRKARTILLMEIPKEHLRKFHGIDDAKEIWEA